MTNEKNYKGKIADAALFAIIRDAEQKAVLAELKATAAHALAIEDYTHEIYRKKAPRPEQRVYILQGGEDEEP